MKLCSTKDRPSLWSRQYRSNPSKEGKIKYLQKLVDRSARDFDFRRSIKEDDKMITLSTCDDYSYDGRLVVHGILEDDNIDSLQN